MSRRQDIFHLTGVKPMGKIRLALAYADGAEFEVDLTEWVGSGSALKPLRNAALFSGARIGAFGRAVVSGDGEIDLAGDNLRNLAVEQAGDIGHERIWNWMHDNGLTIDQAAEVLGISRRMLIYYRNGEKRIPRHIWLACVGWETLQKHGTAA